MVMFMSLNIFKILGLSLPYHCAKLDSWMKSVFSIALVHSRVWIWTIWAVLISLSNKWYELYMGKLKEKLKISDEWWHLFSKMDLLWDTYYKYKKNALPVPLMMLTNTFLTLYSHSMIFILIIILSLILIEYLQISWCVILSFMRCLLHSKHLCIGCNVHTLW